MTQSHNDLFPSAPVPIFVIATEMSGDQLGSALLDQLGRRLGALDVRGFGGQSLVRSGLRSVIAGVPYGIVGLTGVVSAIPRTLLALRAIRRYVEVWRPTVVILIDSPAFNLRVARRIKKLNIPVIYYVSPQVWAWRKGRIDQIRRYVNHVLLLFEFEKAIYARHHIPATWVGHAVVDRVQEYFQRAIDGPTPARLMDDGVLRLGIFPGSRPAEVARMLAPMLQIAAAMGALVEVRVSRAPAVDPELYSKRVAGRTEFLAVEESSSLHLLTWCDVALVASGTVTLEAALVGRPMVVLYRTGWFTYLLGRLMVRDIRHISLVNILAGRELVPEFLQQFDIQQIATMIRRLRYEPAVRKQCLEDLSRFQVLLGSSGASARAANVVLKHLQPHGPA